ncbi:hypothetical protein [Nostoc sp.]|uniref:hypothetical protein n=1 Tax=Nostoc sp. TaxID=1180 RepID=UPI002FFA2C15
MSGFLSQVVANLVAAEQQIKSLSGLPAAAQQIQTNSSAIILPMVSQIQTMQQAGSGFVQTAIAQLNEIETMVLNNQVLPEIEAKMATVLSQASTLKSTVDEVFVRINSVSSQVLGYFNQLAVIESDLTSQMTALQGQLGNAQSEEEAAKKKYYYLIALGPFGLIGLAVALGLYLKWQSDVNDYESQISSLNSQINSFNAMKSACQLMVSDFQGLVTKISGVRNSVDFLVSDILTINSDLDTGTTLLVIGIMVKAAITEVTTLGVDAS